MDDSSPMKTACVYDRKLTEVEKLTRKTDILVERLVESENRNSELIRAQKEKTVKIEKLNLRLIEMERKNGKLAEKLVRLEENELLDS